MHPFPLIEAFWASLDEERPSGDDPKRVASALQQFYGDLSKHLEKSRLGRWKTPLFRELEPNIKKNVSALRELITQFAKTGTSQIEQIRSKDESVRSAIFRLQEEETSFGLPVHASPKISQLQYFFEGWKRQLLGPEPLQHFLRHYSQTLRQTQKELQSMTDKPSPKESDNETEAVERAISLLSELTDLIVKLEKQMPFGAEACNSLFKSVWTTGEQLGEAFETLEKCSPVKEPCPFCGGQLSLSGRCRGCGRRMPHLEPTEPSEEADLESSFLSQNCRALDLALQAWERDKANKELWQAFQQAVRTFGGHVVQGRKSAEMLATSPERPIDSQDSLRKQEDALMKIGKVYQDVLTRLSKFSQASEPPTQSHGDDWREPLLTAELELKELQEALQPEEAQ